ncbi:MAG: mechanosensitive ion channel [Alphaproteobacteria bacterium]|nr:mechanosensitive ion channel [Alphaproteobacteria bacterium]
MTNIWLNIIKPKGIYAKWLIFLTLLALFGLGATGHFEVVQQHLDTQDLTFKVGNFEISAYKALKSILVVVLVFWTAAIISDFSEKRISKLKKMRAANRALILKIIHIGIYIIAGLFALDIVGIDLTTLTIFSGALGIGLGFGLQKIASNFISGLILLMEKSVEQDDLIELSDGTFGTVKKARARYTLIETFDSREILVPNEDLITNRVVNWTLTNTKGRIEIPVGVSYDSDIEKAQQLILEAAKEHPSSIDDPEPRCYLRNFGDSSVDFILHFWMANVLEGRWIPQSEVMFSIWQKFHENNIEIPFPQRDLHLKTPDMIKVKNNGK